MSVSINGTNGLVFSDGTSQNTSPFTGGFAFRNKLINGAMQIDQRNAGASVSITTPNQYTLDRWQGYMTAAGKFSVQQNAGSVTPPNGFTNYLGVTSSSAWTISAGDIFGVAQYVEGLNIADLGWGRATASTVTLSFWVRSSLTGTFGGSVQNNAGNRTYPFTYTINAANTWEYKTVIIPGDTTGTWLTTNGTGIRMLFGLGCGSTYSGTSGSWTSSAVYSVTGATSVVSTNGATFYITGVQLEKGSTATSFDYRPYGTELALCQRYYWRLFPGAPNQPFSYAHSESADTPVWTMQFPVEMRTGPSLGTTGVAGNFRYLQGGAGITLTQLPTLWISNKHCAGVYGKTAAGTLTGGYSGTLRTNANSGDEVASISFSAEL